MKATLCTEYDNLEKINVEDLISDFRVLNIDFFVLYLKEVWRDLAQRSEDKTQGISKITFSKYYDLPGLILDRLFSVFDANKNDYLDLYEFIDGMKILFSESYENLVKLIFNFYDFDKDGKICKEDVRIVLSYIPLNNKQFSSNFKLKFEKNEFKDRIESQDELHATLDKVFKGIEYFDETAFLYVVENINSDIFLFILIFILEKRPFTNDMLKHFEETTKKSSHLLNVNVNTSKSPQSSSDKLIVSPSLNSKFQPSVTISKSPTIQNKNRLSLTSQGDSSKMLMALAGKNTEAETPSTYSFKYPNDDQDFKGSINEEYSNTIRVSRKFRHGLQELDHNSTSKKKYEETDMPLLPALKFLGKKGEESTNIFNIRLNLSMTCASNQASLPEENQEGDPTVNFCGFLYKITSSNKLKKMWYKLIYKDLYYFKTPEDTEYKGMHNFSGVVIKEESSINFDGMTLFSFSVEHPKKSRIYYVNNEDDYKKWLFNLRRAIGYSDLSDIYDVKETIGTGKYGIVRLGIHRESERKVAIKIMNKRNMSMNELEHVKTEIEILKIAQHPNIIRLYDIFENNDYFYIIMEYCEGGDLFSHLEVRNFKLPEPRAAQIIHKLATAVYFLHEYGIAHRDLKPENILMTDLTDDADIRLLDFGLSKILGPNQTCNEPYGTISYISPEVLMEKPYDKKVDLWTIGIITYLLLCGFLPFDDEFSEKEIARKTIHEPVRYPKSIWLKISVEAKSFVKNLLQKDPLKRMTIKEVLEHQWIQKYHKTNLPEIRRKCKDISGGNTFLIYASTEDSQN